MVTWVRQGVLREELAVLWYIEGCPRNHVRSLWLCEGLGYQLGGPLPTHSCPTNLSLVVAPGRTSTEGLLLQPWSLGLAWGQGCLIFLHSLTGQVTHCTQPRVAHL